MTVVTDIGVVTVKWRETVEEALRTARFCYPMPDGQYPEVDTEEFLNCFVPAIQSLVYDERKKLFFAGYRLGAEDAVSDAGLTVDPDLNKHGAWKRWDEVNRE